MINPTQQTTFNQHEPGIFFVEKGKQCRPRSDSEKTWGRIMVHFITVSNSVDADQAQYFCSTCLQRLPADVTSWQRIPTTVDTSIDRVKPSTIYVKQ